MSAQESKAGLHWIILVPSILLFALFGACMSCGYGVSFGGI